MILHKVNTSLPKEGSEIQTVIPAQSRIWLGMIECRADWTRVRNMQPRQRKSGQVRAVAAQVEVKVNQSGWRLVRRFWFYLSYSVAHQA